MSDTLRPYKDLFPEIGQRVMIDTSSVIIGDVRLADDVGIWPACGDSRRCELRCDRGSYEHSGW
nr:transferase [Salmonella sp. NCTC 7297]